MRKRLPLPIAGAVLLTLAGWGARHVARELGAGSHSRVPVTSVKRGDVTFTVVARGELQGGNSKTLTAPMTGSPQLILTTLRKSGDMVAEGEVVAEFDTTEETYKLREAEADLAEAEQQVIQATHEALAKEEELNNELIKTRGDLALAEIECERNPLLPDLVARQNELALEATRDRLRKLEQDYPSRKAAATASIAIQQAARKKAEVAAETARRNIGLMTLKAPMAGYVNVERNTNSNFFFPGMQFPILQVGDTVRAGTGVVQIPDMRSWEITAKISEQDRGLLAAGQPAEIRVVALPGRVFHGRVTNLGGTTGPPWDRRFECKMSLDDPEPELRPGMSTQMVVTTEMLRGVLWIPAQALFESDGRKQVFVQQGEGFVAKEVEMVRGSETRVVVKGLGEGETIATANPSSQSGGRGAGKGEGGGSGAAKAVQGK
ncbi:MAG: efflux RND transporter periplasmic adaptor subunit [Bryobacteraceae bacterium]